MTIHIPTKYLVYGGLAVALGLGYWYLKSQGYWDQWFNAQGNLIPVGPAPAANPPAVSVPGVSPTPSSQYVN